METDHQRTQREARERKALKRKAHSEQAFKRKVAFVEVDKGLLFKILDAEQLIPEGATKILETGHRPESLTLTVAFD